MYRLQVVTLSIVESNGTRSLVALDIPGNVQENREMQLSLCRFSEFWATLTQSGKRSHWLKFDFNRWKDPEGDSDPEDPDLMSNEEKMKDWAKRFGKNAPTEDESSMAEKFDEIFISKSYYKSPRLYEIVKVGVQRLNNPNL